jgi:subtilisin family serine protease
MLKRIRSHNKLSALLLLFLAACLFSACGYQGIDTQVRSKIAAANVPLATADNVSDWWSSWDKKTFLMGVVEQEGLSEADATAIARSAVSQALLSLISERSVLTNSNLRLAQDAINESLIVERQALIPDADLILDQAAVSSKRKSNDGLQVSNYFVSVPAIANALKAAAEFNLPHVNRMISSFSTQSGIVGLMNTLATTQGAQWVEPNLVGYLPRERLSKKVTSSALELAPEFKYNTSIVSVLKRVRADSAYSFVERSKPTLSSVTVAVLDTGVDSAHPELKDQMFVNPGEKQDGADNDNNCYADDIFGIDATVECGRDDSVVPRPGHADLGGAGKQCPRARADDELSANCGHGSHVAGIIAAKHGGDLSTIGICPSCKILSIRVAERCLQPATNETGECQRPMSAFDPLTSYEVDGGISDTSQVRALTYLYNLRAPDNRNRLLVNVVNLSLGKYFASRSMSYIIRNLQRKNIIVVAAAGNDGTETPSYPAAYDSVVAVCATSEDYSKGAYGRAPFSNFGDWVDICAPGTDIVSTTPGKTFDGGGLFIDKSGTSQATPFVAGALGYLLSYYGNEKSAAQVVEMLKSGADSESLYNSQSNRVPGTGERLYRACYTDTSNCDNLLGAGFLDLDAAIQGRKQSNTNFNFLSNQPGGCVVNSVGSSRIANSQTRWGRFFSGMPFVLLIGYIFLRLLNRVLRGGKFRRVNG